MNIERSFRARKETPVDCVRAIKEAEDLFVSIAEDMNELPDSREKSICLTKLQEAKFWAVECIAKNYEDIRNE